MATPSREAIAPTGTRLVIRIRMSLLPWATVTPKISRTHPSVALSTATA